MNDYFVRFAFHSNECKTTSGQIHPKLFSPPRNLRLSVEFVAEETKDSEIRTRGMNAARRRGKPKLYGWACITECAVHKIGLQVIIDHDPPNHANITGWPESRREQKLMEVKLARTCQPRILSPPIPVSAQARSGA